MQGNAIYRQDGQQNRVKFPKNVKSLEAKTNKSWLCMPADMFVGKFADDFLLPGPCFHFQEVARRFISLDPPPLFAHLLDVLPV